MNDRELLEMAAKAAGIKKPVLQDMRGWGEARYGLSEAIYDEEREEYWNPLVEDGDALRLAVNLRLLVDNGPTLSTVVHEQIDPVEIEHNGNPEAATRIAIVRAAAEIGKAM